MPKTLRLNKGTLLEIITLAYAAGYGPRHVARMTGYAYQTIQAYATAIQLKTGTTRPKPPAIPPRELLIVLMKAGCAS
jgi:hypothetical protein